MKNRIILSTLAAGLLLFSACESDRDSNPTLTVPDSFVLNTPGASSGVYDLDNAEYVELTCTQPDYGYTAPVIYTVEVALDAQFEKSETLSTSYTTAKMEVVASEMAVSITNLQVAEGKTDVDFPMTTPIYVRLKADLSNCDATVYSNNIEIETYLSFSLPPTEFPESMYLIGSYCDWDWDNAVSMVPVYANGDGEYGGSFWSMRYFEDGSALKINTAASWNGSDLGYAGVTIEDNAEASISSSDDGNIVVGNGGWYVVLVKTVIDGLDLVYTVSFNEPNVYLFGDTAGNWDADAEDIFTVPADGTGEFVSPAFVAAGEIRACVVLPDTDWWKSEFIVLNGVLEYRGNGTDQDRTSGSVGQQLYINFITNTGKVE